VCLHCVECQENFNIKMGLTEGETELRMCSVFYATLWILSIKKSITGS
jgi:hypothetical protein